MINRVFGYWFLSDVYDENNNISYFVGSNINGLFSWNHTTNEFEILDESKVFSLMLFSEETLLFISITTL